VILVTVGAALMTVQSVRQYGISLFASAGVAGIVAGVPGLTVMLVEVVPPTMRGIAASVTGFLAALVAAASPPVVGFLADQFKFNVNGELKGHVANAFLIVTPLVWVGAWVVWRGRRHVRSDIDRAMDIVS
jgi:MFS family permease